MTCTYRCCVVFIYQEVLFFHVTFKFVFLLKCQFALFILNKIMIFLLMCPWRNCSVSSHICGFITLLANIGIFFTTMFIHHVTLNVYSFLKTPITYVALVVFPLWSMLQIWCVFAFSVSLQFMMGYATGATWITL